MSSVAIAHGVICCRKLHTYQSARDSMLLHVVVGSLSLDKESARFHFRSIGNCKSVLGEISVSILTCTIYVNMSSNCHLFVSFK